MGGPGSGNFRTPQQQKDRHNRSLGHLYPLAVQKLGPIVDKGEDSATLRWIIEMKDGKPSQQVNSNITGELVIRVVYEPEVIPPDSTQKGKSSTQEKD